MFNNFVKQAQAAVNSVDSEIRSHLVQPTNASPSKPSETPAETKGNGKPAESASWAPTGWNMEETFASMTKSAKDAVNSIQAPKLEVPNLNLENIQKSISSIDVSSIGTSLSQSMKAAADLASTGSMEPVSTASSGIIRSRPSSPTKDARQSVDKTSAIEMKLEEERSQRLALEQQIATLRTKAKARITQLQSELEAAKSSQPTESAQSSQPAQSAQSNDSAEAVRAELEATKLAKLELENRLESLDSKSDVDKLHSRELEQEKARGEGIINALESDVSSLKARIAELESTNPAAAESEVGREADLARIRELEQALAAANDKLASLSEPQVPPPDADLKSQLSAAEESLAKLQEDIAQERTKWEAKHRDWTQERQLFQQQILEATEASARQPKMTTEQLQELEHSNFVLIEQAKDLQIQVRNRNEQITGLQQQISTLTADLDKAKRDHEEKGKKMKSVLTALRAKLDASNEKLQETEQEMEQLKHRLESESHEKQQLDGNTQHLQAEIERLQRTQRDEQELRMQAEVDAQAKVASAERELLNFKTEFQKYKVKAAAALTGQRNDALEERIGELEQDLVQARKDLLDKTTSLEEASERIREIEGELSQALDRIEMLDGKLKEGERFRFVLEQRAKDAQDRAKVWDVEKESLEKAMQIKIEATQQQVDLLKQELEKLRSSQTAAVVQKEEELKSIRAISEQLTVQLETVKADARKRETELLEARRASTSAGTPSVQRQSIDKPPRQPATPTQRNHSSGLVALQELLMGPPTPTAETPRTPGSANPTRDSVPIEEFNAMEKKLTVQIQQLSELLSEGEKEMQRMVAQEKILKEAIRNLEGSEKRAGMNIEYLKNIVMRFVETSQQDRVKLVTVLTQVLALTQEEAARIKKGLEAETSIIPKLW